MKYLIATILLLLPLSANPPAFADSKGNFPGQGSPEAYNKAVDIMNEGADRADKKDYEGAITCYKRAISIYPYDAGFYQNTAFALMKLKRFKDALPFYKKSLELEPNFFMSLLGYGACLWETESLAEAETCFRRALIVQPNSFQATVNLGVLLHERGKNQEARTWLHKAKSNPKYKDYPGEVDAALRKIDDEEKSRKD